MVDAGAQRSGPDRPTGAGFESTANSFILTSLAREDRLLRSKILLPFGIFLNSRRR